MDRIVLLALTGAFIFAQAAKGRLSGIEEARAQKRDEKRQPQPTAQAA